MMKDELLRTAGVTPALSSCRSEQDFSRDSQAADEVSDHLQAEVAAAGKDFRDAAAAAEQGHEVLRFQPLLLHAETNRRHGVRLIQGKNLLLVIVHEQGQEFQFVPLRRIGI